MARFLVVLELFREGAVTFEQPESLGRLVIRWTGQSDADEQLRERLAREYDDPARAADPDDRTGEGVG